MTAVVKVRKSVCYRTLIVKIMQPITLTCFSKKLLETCSTFKSPMHLLLNLYYLIFGYFHNPLEPSPTTLDLRRSTPSNSHPQPSTHNPLDPQPLDPR